jgi:hypothetical protein
VARDGPGREEPGSVPGSWAATGLRPRIGCRSGQCGGAGVGPAASMAEVGTPASAPGAGGSGDVGLRHRTRCDVRADPRFAANYGSEARGSFVRDALRIYAAKHL